MQEQPPRVLQLAGARVLFAELLEARRGAALRRRGVVLLGVLLLALGLPGRGLTAGPAGRRLLAGGRVRRGGLLDLRRLLLAGDRERWCGGRRLRAVRVVVSAAAPGP